MSYFEELGLAEPILRALNSKGYSEPTPIQRKAIPSLLEGRDLLGIAQTGTGKTAAFSLPSLHRLASETTGRHPAGCRMLVLSPTRELAAQIAENMRHYARFLDLSVQCVFGGVPVGKQAKKLVPGCDVLVATPGRLLDLIDQRALTLRHVEIFVLDEADQMMDLGFIKPLTRIANLLPKERQSLFFSATMPKAIADLGKRFINNPVRVEIAPQSTTAERVDQYVTFIDQKEKTALLTISLRKGIESGEIERCLVFTRTKHGADRLVRHLSAANIVAAAIHGNKTQAQRTRALDGFREGRVPVLVATDIAARGIDVPGVSAVFNFELPNVPEQYVHRIGRTARAGRDGMAISYVSPDEKAYLRDIQRVIGVQLSSVPLPANFNEQAAALPKPSRKPAGAERAESSGAETRKPRGQRPPRRPKAQISAKPRGDGKPRKNNSKGRNAGQNASQNSGQKRQASRNQSAGSR
ncbi:DEAD/DEAH box helicase [Altericroceibacterium spongiae]|uniref:DEAD/DEAH box helicase n=1 Tax=Altericroceibacterium spongiae TaxID=2320269 RepID=A0A420EMQ9_9SPHN|nr:DEAD/DEAH box helicase [Altericroceibacterium spongiae]RKF21931.1 DEAD/DEAH box helicase [Altericroceibacterium spongiae]